MPFCTSRLARGLPTIFDRPTITACFPEVCGDAAYYIDPHDELNIASGIHTVITDNELRQVLIDKGLERAKSFNWNIPGEIVIVPPYNRETMDEFFASIDVLLFPSQWKESFGLTVREAIARGVWVIATEAGGVGVQRCFPHRQLGRRSLRRRSPTGPRALR